MAHVFLPDGEDFLLGLVPQGSEENEIYLVEAAGREPTDAVLLMRNAAGVRYTPAGGGRVLFVRNDNLYAQTLNRRTRRLEGDPELMQQGVASRGTVPRFRCPAPALSRGGRAAQRWRR